MAQDEFLADVKVLLEDDATIVGLANTQLLSEEFQTAEDWRFVVIDISNQLGVDDIHAIHTTYQHQTILGDADRTLVVRALLQSILGAEAAHIEGPLALVVLLRYHVGYAILGNHPHGVLLILGNAHHARANQSAVHIQQRLLVVLPIHNATARGRAMPYQTTTILENTGRRRHGRLLTFDGRNLHVGHLTTHGVDERVILRVTHHEPALGIPGGCGHKVLGHGRVMRVDGAELTCFGREALHATTQGSHPDVAPLILGNRPDVVIEQFSAGIRHGVVPGLSVVKVNQSAIVGTKPY